MKNRTSSGSVTTFSVAILFLVLMLGTFAFYFMRQLSGGRELEHACDAGVLNAARAALLTPSVKLSEIDATALPAVKDFFRLSVPPNSGPNDFTNPITLLTYNRLIAQCMLVTNNAEAEGSPAAIAHAREVIHAAQAVGLALRNKMLTGGGNNPLNPSFVAVSQTNPLEGFVSHGANINLVNDVTCHWLRYSASANIYLDPNTMVSTTPQDAAHPSAPPPTENGIPAAGISMDYYKAPLAVSRPSMTVEYYPQTSYTPINPFSAAYVQGYTPLLLLGNYGSPEVLTAVPTMPQQAPHLVSLEHFNEPGHLVGPDLYSPPNAVGAQCKTSDNAAEKSQVASTTLAAALIGSLSKDLSGIGTPSTDFVASIPAGYIPVVNLPTALKAAQVNGVNAVVPTGNLYAGQNDLFNTNAAASNSAAVDVTEPINTEYGSACLFSTATTGNSATSVLTPWETFAKSVNTAGATESVLGKMYDLSKDPTGGAAATMVASSIPNANIMVAVENNPPASLQDLLNLTAQTKPLFQVQDGNMSPATLPAYITNETVAIIATALGRATLSKDGVNGSYSDIVSYVKMVVQDLRSKNITVNLHLPLLSTGVALSGMQYYERVSPKATKPGGGKNKHAYIKHYAQYAESEQAGSGKWLATGGSQPYAFDGSPAKYLSAINELNDGPLPVATGLSKKGVVNVGYPSQEPSSGAQDHTFNPNSPSFNTFLAPIVARCAQIVPGTTREQVLTVLGFNDISSQPTGDLFDTTTPGLKLGDTWYIHADPNNPNKLVYDQNVPYADPSLQPDSVTAANGTQNNTPYVSANYIVTGGAATGPSGGRTNDLNSLIDTAVDDSATATVGDMGYHAMPDLHAPYLEALDSANFIPSSGYGNLLGKIQFYTQLQPVIPTANGIVQFSLPN